MIASIDLSLRSTGVVILTYKGSFIDCNVIGHSELDNEALIEKNSKDILRFLRKYKSDIKRIAIEGLSYAGKNPRKDLIHGNFWVLRCAIKKEFPHIKIDVVPVATWRKYIITPDVRKEIKAKGLDNKKGWQKVVCVDALSKDIKKKFLNYMKRNKSRLTKGKESLYDLTDAYWIGKYIIRIWNS